MDTTRTAPPVQPKPHAPRGRRSLAILVIACAALALGLGAGLAFFRGGPEPEENRATPSEKPAAEKTPGCERDLEAIRGLFRSIPEDWREAPDLAKLTADVRQCRRLSEAFLSTCRGSKDEHEVQFMLARVVLSLNKVEWTEYVNEEVKKGASNSAIIEDRKRWAAEYFGRVQGLARSALGKAPPGSDLRAQVLDLLADALLQGGKAAESLESYRKLLEETPAYKDRMGVYLAMANAHLELEQTSEGIAVVRKAMAELPDNPSIPYCYEWLWKLETAAGNLPALLRITEEMREALPKRARRVGIGRLEKETCEKLYGYSGFRLGYSRFALGDLAGAAEAFRESIAFLENAVAQDLKVYRDIRCRDNLEALENRIGRPPQTVVVEDGRETREPADLRAAYWGGGRKPALDGRALGLVLRNRGDDRSAPFLQALDRHVRGRRGDLELATLSTLIGDDDPQGQLAEAMAEAEKLGLQCAVGIDPDPKKKGLFRAFTALGSTAFVILDRSGNCIWFQQDPKEFDARFSIAILERIAK